jgi:transcriptional regulator with XRE-family HTH domain
MSQRRIAAMTGQSQSEISEILSGRRVVSYDVLLRIADGLGVPRGLMGLAHCVASAGCNPGPAARNGHEHPPTEDDKRGLAR